MPLTEHRCSTPLQCSPKFLGQWAFQLKTTTRLFQGGTAACAATIHMGAREGGSAEGGGRWGGSRKGPKEEVDHHIGYCPYGLGQSVERQFQTVNGRKRRRFLGRGATQIYPQACHTFAFDPSPIPEQFQGTLLDIEAIEQGVFPQGPRDNRGNYRGIE